MVLDARCIRTFFLLTLAKKKKPSDYYELIKLSPAYQVYFGHLDFVTIADNLPEIVKL